MSIQHNGFHPDDQHVPDRTPDCVRVAPLLERLYDGTLATADRMRVEPHAAACAYCSAVLAQYATLDQMVRAAPAPRVDGRLRASLYARIARVDTHPASARHANHGVHPRPPIDPRPDQPAWPREIPRGETGGRRGPPWMGGFAAAAVVLGLALVFTLLARHGTAPGSTPMSSTPSATAQRAPHSVVVPAFTDWRAAYLSSDGAVHVVSLDGHTDLTGPALPGLSERSVFAAMSPDGHHVAYVDNPKWGNLIVVDLRSGAAVTFAGKITSVSWSPDGTRLVGDATLASVHGLYVFSASSGGSSLVPQSADGGQLGYPELRGWYDDTHLLADVSQTAVSGAQGAAGQPSVAQHLATPALASVSFVPRSSSSKVLAAVDVQTGQARALYSSSTSGIVLRSPDHTLGLAENGCGAGCTFQPGIFRVTFASGQSQPLPNITAAINGNLEFACWLPGTHTVMAVGPTDSPRSGAFLLLDIDHDTVTTINHGIYPITLTPDEKTLIAGDLTAFNSIVTVYPLYALSPVSAAVKITLTQHMMIFLGLIKTA